VEALVAVEEVEGIDPMPLFVLRSFEFARPADVEHLDDILHIGRQVMRQLLNGMAANGLVASDSEPTYRLTESGRNTLQTGHVIRRIPARRIFRFLHPAMNFVAVHDPKGNLLSDLSPDRAPSPWEFSPDVLRRAIVQSADWKRRHGFPANVADVLTEPLSSEDTHSTNPEVGVSVVSPGSSQGQEALQHLIVDKAQVVTCALVMRRGDTDSVELSGHPVSVNGNLVRGNGQPLISLRDPGEVREAFPVLLRLPSTEEVVDGWLTLAARLMLPEAEQAEVKFENDVLVVVLAEEHLGRWMNFLLLAMQDQLYWQVSKGPFLQLCKVAVEGADPDTSMRLQSLRCLLSLEQDSRQGKSVRSEGALREWLAVQGLPLDMSPRGLADVAFRFGRYRLAYEIAELEDMSDATV
jgi:hypothetical protein